MWFPGWAEALATEPLEPLARAERKSAIIRFLGCCKREGIVVTANAAKRFIEQEERQDLVGARDALRWFFRKADKIAGDAPATAAGGGPLGPRLHILA